MLENKDADINQWKVLSDSTRKSVTALEPLSRLWLIIENKKLSSTECDDEEDQEMIALSRLFEKTMLLIG